MAGYPAVKFQRVGRIEKLNNPPQIDGFCIKLLYVQVKQPQIDLLILSWNIKNELIWDLHETG